MRLAGVRKIAVLRANGLGDLMVALPALEALRVAYPKAEMVLLGQPLHAALLENRPGPIDRVIPVPISKGVREEPGLAPDPEELERFFAAMRQEAFDLAVQLHGGGRNSNPFVLELGARTTAGLKSPDAVPLDRWVPYVYFQLEVLRWLEVVSLIGAEPQTLEPRLTVTQQDLEQSYQVVPNTDRPLVALHPGATDPKRRWPADKFAAVGDSLAETGAMVLITGTRAEGPVASAVASSMREQALDLSGKLSLGALVGILSRCRLVVSNDSGPMHLAAAVGAATVGIYWCGNMITAAPATRMRHRPLISWQLECPTCKRHIIHDPCGHGDSFVAEVPAKHVVEAALELTAGADLPTLG